MEPDTELLEMAQVGYLHKRAEIETRIGELRESLTTGQEPKGLISRVMSQMGRRGGPIGGYARAKSLTPARRKEIAVEAANARWGNGAPEPVADGRGRYERTPAMRRRIAQAQRKRWRKMGGE